MRFVLAGVASEVGHGMVGLFRQVRHYKVGLDKTGFGQVCTAGTVGLRVVRFGSVY